MAVRFLAYTSGIGLLILAVIVVSEIITLVTGSYMHWSFVGLGILVALAAVRAINS